MIREILLSVPTFPDAAPERVLESAATLSQLLGARLTADMRQLNSDQATWPLVVGAFPLDFPQLMHELVAKSEANAAASAKALTELCAQRAVNLDLRRGLTSSFAGQAPLVDLARLHDLVVLPVPESDTPGRDCVRDVVFGGGRPVLLLPSSRKPLHFLDRIVVAWDWSREAARALSDAMPLFSFAREVHILTIFGEKHIETTASRADLERLLASHNVKAACHQRDLGKARIGDALLAYADSVNADLLVMGAYGHGRLQEFVLGGATREILRNPPLPLLLSH